MDLCFYLEVLSQLIFNNGFIVKTNPNEGFALVMYERIVMEIF